MESNHQSPLGRRVYSPLASPMTVPTLKIIWGDRRDSNPFAPGPHPGGAPYCLRPQLALSPQFYFIRAWMIPSTMSGSPAKSANIIIIAIKNITNPQSVSSLVFITYFYFFLPTCLGIGDILCLSSLSCLAGTFWCTVYLCCILTVLPLSLCGRL